MILPHLNYIPPFDLGFLYEVLSENTKSCEIQLNWLSAYCKIFLTLAYELTGTLSQVQGYFSFLIFLVYGRDSPTVAH